MGGVVLAGIGAAIAASLLLDGERPERFWLVAVLAALVALDQQVSVRFLRGPGQGETRAHEEALLVFIALTVPPLAGIAAFAAGIILGELLTRRGLVKGTFNVAQLAGSATLAFAVIAAFPTVEDSRPGELAAVLVGVLAFSLVNRVAVATVLALTRVCSFRADMLADIGPAALTWGGTVSVGLLAGLAGETHPWALPFALAALILLSFALSGHTRARRERQTLRDLVESAAAPIFSVDRAGRIRTWNPQMERSTGRSVSEVVGRQLGEAVSFRDAQGAPVDPSSLPEVAERSGPGLVRLDSLSGDDRWLLLSRSHLPDGGFTFVGHDFTRQMAAEALTALQRHVLELIASGAPLADVLEVLTTLIEERCDGALASFLLLDEDGVRLRHGAAPSLPDAYIQAIDGVAIGPSVGSCGTAAYRKERVIVADIASDPLWADFRDLALGYGLRACWSTPIVATSGTVLGTFAIYYREPRSPSEHELELIEIASHLAAVALERQRQEAALAQSEEARRRLVERLPLAVYVDETAPGDSALILKSTYFSPQIEAMLGYSPAEWRADRELFSKILHPDDRERIVAAIEQARVGQDRFSDEYRLVAKDGRVVWVHDEALYLRDGEGRVNRVEGCMVDVTERKALESDLLQAQKMDAIGQLAGGVAHDFNNMMSAVVGFSELVLARLEEGSVARRHVEEIKRAGERATALTHQLLAFSRKQVLAPRILDANAVVAGAESLLRRLIGEDIDLVTALNPDVDPVEADAGQLEQVVVNLAVNARDAMPLGGKLTIETLNVEVGADHAASHFDLEPGPYVVLAVSDTGVGMDAATKARIFEPFFTTKEPGKGTGLGLATVYGIVKQSGGDISVYSEPGRGTTFRVYLPRAQASSEPAEPQEEQLESPRGSETILLVEDEEVVRNLGREILEERGYQVLVAEGPRAAFDLSARHEGPIHLLLSDVVMPDLSGPDLAKLVASARPEAKVLYASGYAHEAIVRHGVLQPGIYFLAKPFTPDALARKVREVLDSPA